MTKREPQPEARWERFFNWQSDQDWTWGPFVGLRPARYAAMPVWVWARLFVALSGAGMLLIGLAGTVCAFGPRLAARQHWAVPPGAAETLATLAAMASDRTAQALGLCLALCLPLLFFGFCWPFHAAWNRRAARLSRLPRPASAEAPEGAQSAVWPPAPTNPSR